MCYPILGEIELDTKKVLIALSKALPENEQRRLYICGGAALNLLGISGRETADIDVLDPKLDDIIKDAGAEVAREFGLSEKWLNNGPASLLRDLEPGWKERAVLAFSDEKLKVFSLSRQELINSKLWAACDRLQDIADMVFLAPTEAELEKARQWVLPLDASELWPDIVNQCLEVIRKRLKDERDKR